MPDVIACPHCQRKLRVTDELMGQPVKCPTCATTFTAQPEGTDLPSPVIPVETPWRPLEVEPVPVPQPPRRDRDDYDDYRPRRRRFVEEDYVPHRGSAILVLGIVSLVFLVVPVIGLVLGIIAWIMGHTDLEEIRTGRMDPEGEGSTNAGRICGMIGVIGGLLVLFAALVVVFVLLLLDTW
jgi:predicted Zn finger-like uncharacterized protein